MASFRCPTVEEVTAATLALLPRGRAWQTHETGPMRGEEPGFSISGFAPDAFSTRSRKPSILWAFWRAVAGVIHFLSQRLCDLRLEFWCATQSETNDLWLQEYGLPDDCDPFPDLCLKVAAIGGTRCEYYALVAARAGWSIACTEIVNFCGTRVGSRSSQPGKMRPGRLSTASLRIIVNLSESPAWRGGSRSRPQPGSFKPGRRLSCPPNIAVLECILARVVHAEIQIKYEVA
ncbi:hypothetical protein FNL56_13460 [Tardiphaga sp. vice304]|uniref:hypothetical protein n=1 Tax=Tardiphaga sp. vice304 TaxID=2592817 RepID=UPI00116570B1|nr:hypothetical protein [Tardiphaga sp. vice304]QDM27008.1 hypothetical protein FNL56_13460 [Tardiphaga sp. vice304]